MRVKIDKKKEIYGHLEGGDVFFFEGQPFVYYMVIKNGNGECVRLDDGTRDSIEYLNEVYPVEATLIVK